MKKIVCILLLLSLSLCGCLPEYPREYKLPANWKDVFVEGWGTFAVPATWEYSVEDGIMCFTKNGKPVMISYEEFKGEEFITYSSDFEYIDTITSAIFSNGAVYGRKEYLYQGKKIERCFLEVENGEIEYHTMHFIIWDTSVTMKTVEKMAQLFEPAYP